MKFIDYYEILHVPPNATLSEVRKSYHRLAFLSHPDITGNQGSTFSMQLLNEAYSILGNPVKRAQYDFWRRYYGYIFTSSVEHGIEKAAFSFPQLGTYQETTPQNIFVNSAIKIGLFFGQILYWFIFILLFIGLYFILLLIPFSLYFFVLGKLFAWIAPYILMTSDDALVATLISTTLLLYITLKSLSKHPHLSKFVRMLKLW